MKVPYNKGNKCSNIAFIFACPGRCEKKARRVCAGQTGKNLAKLLKKLNKKCPKLFKEIDIYEYLITNACEVVHPNKTCTRKTPTKKEIEKKSNLARLNRELSNVGIIIPMGEDAIDAIIAMRREGYLNEKTVIFGRHLSPSALNGLRNSSFAGKSKQCKLNALAKEIVNQLYVCAKYIE